MDLFWNTQDSFDNVQEEIEIIFQRQNMNIDISTFWNMIETRHRSIHTTQFSAKYL